MSASAEIGRNAQEKSASAALYERI